MSLKEEIRVNGKKYVKKKSVCWGQENVIAQEMTSTPVHEGYSLLIQTLPFVLVQDPSKKETTDLNSKTISVAEQG